MLSTKNMKSGGGKKSPVISLGNQVFKINDVTFEQTPYDSDAYDIKLHVESKPVEGEFKGFLVDPKNENGPRYTGQVGRIRFSPYSYKNKTLPSGIEIKRDQEVLKAMAFLAEALDMRTQLDMIEAEDVFEFMKACRQIFKDNNIYINACVGGSEWQRTGEDYVNYNLFLPKLSKNGVPLEKLDVDNSRLIKYDADKHIIKKKNKPNNNPNGFANNKDIEDEFNIF